MRSRRCGSARSTSSENRSISRRSSCGPVASSARASGSVSSSTFGAAGRLRPDGIQILGNHPKTLHLLAEIDQIGRSVVAIRPKDVSSCDFGVRVEGLVQAAGRSELRQLVASAQGVGRCLLVVASGGIGQQRALERLKELGVDHECSPLCIQLVWLLLSQWVCQVRAAPMRAASKSLICNRIFCIDRRSDARRSAACQDSHIKLEFR